MTSDYIVTLYTKKGTQFTMIVTLESNTELATLTSIFLRQYEKITIEKA